MLDAGVQRLIKRILAIASGGGHWVELQRLSPAFENLDVVYASVYPEYANEVPGHRFYSFRDVSRWDRFGFVVLFIQLLHSSAERPKIVITTGSLPCCIALMLAKYLFGAKTMWIDSIANVQQLSSSGRLAGKFADVWLTRPKIVITTGSSPLLHRPRICSAQRQSLICLRAICRIDLMIRGVFTVDASSCQHGRDSRLRSGESAGCTRMSYRVDRFGKSSN